MHCAKCDTCLAPTDSRKVREKTADPLVYRFFCGPDCTPTELLPRAFSSVHDMYDEESRRTQQLVRYLAGANQEIDRLQDRVETLQAELQEAGAAPGRTIMCDTCEAIVPQCVHCFQPPATIACVPCGHRVVCSDDCRAVIFPAGGIGGLNPLWRCPICRRFALHVLKTY